jgi:hypothetical protein
LYPSASFIFFRSSAGPIAQTDRTRIVSPSGFTKMNWGAEAWEDWMYAPRARCSMFWWDAHGITPKRGQVSVLVLAWTPVEQMREWKFFDWSTISLSWKWFFAISSFAVSLSMMNAMNNGFPSAFAAFRAPSKSVSQAICGSPGSRPSPRTRIRTQSSTRFIVISPRRLVRPAAAGRAAGWYA